MTYASPLKALVIIGLLAALADYQPGQWAYQWQQPIPQASLWQAAPVETPQEIIWRASEAVYYR